MDDIFIYPELSKIDVLGEFEKKESAENLVDNISQYSKILIVGEGQSGKTNYARKYF